MPPEITNETPIVTEPAGFTMPAHGAPAVESTKTPVEMPVKETVVFGGRVFNSQAEALAFADSQIRSQPVVTAQPAAQPTTQTDVNPAGIIFEDPEAALRLHGEQIEKRIEEKYNKAEATKNTWNKFYTENKDLQGMEDFVELAKAKKWNNIKDLPIQESLAILAKDARAMIAKVRSGSGPGERLNPNGATTANPSRAPAPTATTQVTAQKSFVDEIKEMRAKKKKAV